MHVFSWGLVINMMCACYVKFRQKGEQRVCTFVQNASPTVWSYHQATPQLCQESAPYARADV